VTNTRFPGRVYGVGTEPDPRLTLANERTFLAWIRTALALIAGGVALDALGLPLQPALRLGGVASPSAGGKGPLVNRSAPHRSMARQESPVDGECVSGDPGRIA
jgi:uncharacterized membrane protein YidH (DUF202 family)